MTTTQVSKARTFAFCLMALLSSTFLLAQSETVANNTTDTTIARSCSPLMMFGEDLEITRTTDTRTEEQQIKDHNAAINRNEEGDNTRAVQTDRNTAPLAIADNQNLVPPDAVVVREPVPVAPRAAVVVREPVPDAAVVVRRRNNLGVIRNHPLVRTGVALLALLTHLNQRDRPPFPPIHEVFGWEANKPLVLLIFGSSALIRIYDGSAVGAMRDIFPSAYKSYLEPVCNQWPLVEKSTWYNLGVYTLQNALVCPGSYMDFHTIEKKLCTYRYDRYSAAAKIRHFPFPTGYCSSYAGALMTLKIYQQSESYSPDVVATKENMFQQVNLYKQALRAAKSGSLAEAELWYYAGLSQGKKASADVRVKQFYRENVNKIRKELFDSKQDIIRCAQQSSQWYTLAAQVEVDPLGEPATNEDIQRALQFTTIWPSYEWREATGTPENIKRTKLSNIGAAFMLASESYKSGEARELDRAWFIDKEVGDSFSQATIQHTRQTALLFEEAAKLAISSIGDANDETCLSSEEQEKRYQLAGAKFQEAKDSREEDLIMIKAEKGEIAISTSEQIQGTVDGPAS